MLHLDSLSPDLVGPTAADPIDKPQYATRAPDASLTPVFTEEAGGAWVYPYGLGFWRVGGGAT